MYRTIIKHLEAWLDNERRKPLVIRGARQVGKTWVVRYLAEVRQKKLIELNFEKNPRLVSLFEDNDPKAYLQKLRIFLNSDIDPANSLLFLDEIQVAPQLLSKLRWFAEDLPELPVIAAGSLLEFVLEEHAFSMPVGRINYMHLEPLSFQEFLLASQEDSLYDFLSTMELAENVPDIIHEKLMSMFNAYTMIGGMPEALAVWLDGQNLVQVKQVQQDLLATYRDDFAKYAGKLKIMRLDEVLYAVPRMLGQKFVYKNVNPDVQSPAIKRALHLLTQSRLCHQVNCCHANGVPLAAEIRENYFKMILLDVGLVSSLLGLQNQENQWLFKDELINSGGLSEQLVGQLLCSNSAYYREPRLFYWAKETPGSSAEVDYVIQHHDLVVPIEVKAGSTGSLKSLHLFMQLKKRKLAVRINADLPSITDIDTQTHRGEQVQYRLLSIPVYLTEQLPRLLDAMLAGN